MSKLKPYPIWVCCECAASAIVKQGFGYGQLSTYHMGKCDVCGKIKSVTEPRDYGYPKFEGHEKS